MADKLNPDRLSPTGKYADFMDKPATGSLVADYSPRQITDHVFPYMIGDLHVAEAFADQLWSEMGDWNEGTEVETTWGELIKDALEYFKEHVFPTREGT